MELNKSKLPHRLPLLSVTCCCIFLLLHTSVSGQLDNFVGSSLDIAYEVLANSSANEIFGNYREKWIFNKNETDILSQMEEEDQIMVRRWRTDSPDHLTDPEEADPSDTTDLYEYEVYGVRRPTDDVFGHFSSINNSYLILAPIVARPASVYRIVVVPYRAEDPREPIALRASLGSSRGAEITTAGGTGYLGESTELIMKLPNSLPGPRLRLRVEGRQHQNLVFVNTTIVHPSKDFLTIFIYMANTLFTGDHEVNFRVVALKNDMLPYEAPIDVYILDSTGYIVKRWVSRVPNAGLINLSFMTPSIPAGGFWRVRVRTGSQVKEHPFYVVRYYIPRFEIFFDSSPYTFVSDEEVTFGISMGVTNDAPLNGNLTMHLYAKYPWTAPDSEYKLITSESHPYVEGETEVTYPFDLLEGEVPQLEGTELRLDVSCKDSFTLTTVDGFAKTRLISPQLNVSFIGPNPLIFRPGMPQRISAYVSYDDGEIMDAEELAESSLRITTTVQLSTGGTRTLQEIYIPPESEEENEASAFVSVNEEELDLADPILFSNGNSTSSLDEYNVIDSEWDSIWYRRMRFQSLRAKEMYILKSRFAEFRRTGLFTFNLPIPEDSATLTITAVFTNPDGETGGATLEGRANFSPDGRHIHVTSTTDVGVVGEFAIFHVRSNFVMHKFHFMVMSKGILIHSGTEAVSNPGAESMSTLAIAVSREMFPAFKFIAFHVDIHGSLAVDTITLPVEIFHLLEASVTLNQHKDHSKRTVEAYVQAPAGTYVAISSHRTTGYLKQPRNRLTIPMFLRAALSLEPFPMTIGRVGRSPRNTADAESMTLVTTGDSEGEAIQSLQVSGIATLSDTRFQSSSITLGHCETSLGFLECGDGTCYRFEDVCNDIPDCEDGKDEINCQYDFFPSALDDESRNGDKQYRLFRESWWKDLFDTEDGVWAWYIQFIGHGQDEGVGLEVPKTQDDWTLDAFAINQQLGFVILPPMEYNSDYPVFIVLDGPNVCRRGEQVSMRTAVFNSMDTDMLVLLTLVGSDDYQFVHVEEKGVVDYYRPRTSSGDYQHLVFVPGGETKEVFIPISILLQKGTLEITVRMTSQMAWDEESWELEVKPEGAPVYKHTSVLLDLKSRAVFYEFLDIPIDETPEIPLEIIRRYLFGSPQVDLTLSGDVFGPISEEIAVDHVETFKGRSFKSTDGLAFNYGATLWTLHYLRLTNQLDLERDGSAFDFLNVQMAGMLTRFRNGGFKMFHYSGPSVWLTTTVLSLLNNALLEDWEYLTYVDPRVMDDCVLFITEFQTEFGDITETQYYNVTLDSKQRYKYLFGRNVSISLTAFAAATIQESMGSLPGSTRLKATQAVWNAKQFLDKAIDDLDDPYDIAITAWAMSILKSSEKDAAVAKLLEHMRSEDGFLYWSPVSIQSNSRVFENNQRTFILPKEPQPFDASAIEATSYALLVLLNREGVTNRQERIVNWLISVRDWDKAFDSTADTLVALRALTEYCYRARVRDVTELTVEVLASSAPDFDANIQIDQPFVAALNSLEIPNPWGHVMLTGRGAGQALAQLTMTWGVDVPRYQERPPRNYFSLSVTEYHHIPMNKTRITTTVCTKWIATDLRVTSHAAVVEVEVPSGYVLHQPLANKVAKNAKLEGHFPQMSDALVTDSYVFFQFDYIPPHEQCFSYDLYRWFQVANLTFIRSAMIYELYAPEHFEQIIMNSTTLSSLDICEVCGSSQCPYCPFYSGSPSIEAAPILLLALLCLSLVNISLFNNFSKVKLDNVDKRKVKVREKTKSLRFNTTKSYKSDCIYQQNQHFQRKP